MNKLLKQLINFVGVSGIGWILDFLVYTVFAFLSLGLFWCNILGAIAGVSFVFVFSSRFIFQNKNKIPIFVKYIIYILYQIILVYFISKLLVVINNGLNSHLSFVYAKEFCAILAKIIITPITMILNFIILKNIIEKL